MALTLPHPVSTWLNPDNGQPISHQTLMTALSKKQVVLLGETHDRYDIHRWQLSITIALYTLRENIVVGFEMFPRSTQPILDKWTAGTLSETHFLKEIDWKTVWGFPAELYLPLFRFCREFNVRMIALNCYRPLVTRVGKEGWDAIPEADRDGLSPAKPATQEYLDYLASLMGKKSPFFAQSKEEEVRRDRFVRAQQTWDRAFACNIAKSQTDETSPLVIGIIGRGHLEYGHGTPYQLKDLGIEEVSVLLPSDEAAPAASKLKNIADACFRLPPMIEKD
ncbi:MAG: ChaN family lipoprotein [Sneathiella sp.]